MDVRGARILRVRIALGAAPGERVEVVSVQDGVEGIQPGETGTVLSLGETGASVAFDSGEQLVVDPFTVHLRPVPVPPAL